MIAIGCDHGAIDLKNQLIEHLKKKGYECNDVGTYTTESCDYPVYAHKVIGPLYAVHTRVHRL